MTRQETIEKTWSLLELLETLPDSVDITTVQVRIDSSVLLPLQIHLNSGMEAVSELFNIPIKTRIPNEYIYKEIYTRNCEFVQLESAAEIIKAALGADNTRGRRDGLQAHRNYTSIISREGDEVKP